MQTGVLFILFIIKLPGWFTGHLGKIRGLHQEWKRVDGKICTHASSKAHKTNKDHVI